MTRRVAALAMLLLAGCASVPPPERFDDWPSRRAALQALDAWTLDGRIAVAAGEEGFSGGFDWSQAGDRADIVVAPPMGGASYEIRLDSGRLTLEAHGETYSDEDARRMIAQRLGGSSLVPIEAMRYWLVGAPAPDAPADETLGDDERLALLTQSGWHVRYDRYESAGALALPTRMEMTSEGLRLRVVVSDWQLPP